MGKLAQAQIIVGGEKRFLGGPPMFAQRLPFGFKFGAEQFLELFHAGTSACYGFQLKETGKHGAREEANRNDGVGWVAGQGAAGCALQLGDEVFRFAPNG